MGQGAICHKCAVRAAGEGPAEFEEVQHRSEEGSSVDLLAPCKTASEDTTTSVGAAGEDPSSAEPLISPEPCAPSMDNDLTPEQAKRLAELERHLATEPEPVISEHLMEHARERHLRFLRTEDFCVTAAFRKLQEHAGWWKEYGMDDFVEEDEFDEAGPLFVCGEDLQGRPTLVARPCMHSAKSREESVRAARRCVYTIQRCVERHRPGVDKHSLIYDAAGLKPRRHLDRTFIREMCPVNSHFPERVHRIIVINMHWSMSAVWAAIRPFLHPLTQAKITFCSHDFGSQLSEIVGPDHPYLRYALAVRGLPAGDAARVPLPRRTPFVRGWTCDLDVSHPSASAQGSVREDALSQQSTEVELDLERFNFKV
mmetsp:Transcript_33453/g.77707  ORF Transcript_33453/g.77707 Transcript_33453/m.77707 type:complete len:369 (-) Transcript_33453:260-1366(-)|eukprot:CAMPEP_0171061868 /NCGR_PEP_ID=MMETSP0766_2-20121228/4721_1 /TAXON_ID=439317 /ORGANISM="Gambierdiscus australes, Strain CAWD 149" /LENGTH=368 /DNA_ID=CAMNT_0011517613 /DNA_START=51 /DNA_END=1157 /DNA_ORIENTATION=+